MLSISLRYIKNMHVPTQLYYCVGLFALLDKSTKNQYKQLA